MALGIVCGLMDLLSDEIQAMPPPKGGKAGPRRGSTADTDDEDPDRTVSEGEMPAETSTPLGAQPAKPQSKETPASTAGSVDPTMAAEIQRQINTALEIQAEMFRNEADEQRRKQDRELENKINELNAQKADDIKQAIRDAESAFNAFAEEQASKAEEREKEIQRLSLIHI